MEKLWKSRSEEVSGNLAVSFVVAREAITDMSHQTRDREPDGDLNVPACDLSEKRGHTMSRKALESAEEIKRHKADNSEKNLWRVMRSVEALDPASCTKNVLPELVAFATLTTTHIL